MLLMETWQAPGIIAQWAVGGGWGGGDGNAGSPTPPLVFSCFFLWTRRRMNRGEGGHSEIYLGSGRGAIFPRSREERGGGLCLLMPRVFFGIAYRGAVVVN